MLTMCNTPSLQNAPRHTGKLFSPSGLTFAMTAAVGSRTCRSLGLSINETEVAN